MYHIIKAPIKFYYYNNKRIIIIIIKIILIIKYIIMTEDIKKYKLYFLQLKYTRLMIIINCLENHFSKMTEQNILEPIQSLEFSNKLYNIIKDLNTYYNNYINYYLESNKTDIDILLTCVTLSYNSNDILLLIKKYENNIISNLFKETINEINELIKHYGYINLHDMLKIILPTFNFNTNINNLIEELNDIIIPINYNIFTTSTSIENNDYYWRIPNQFNSSDILEKCRELWIKLDTNKYLRIDLIFVIDKFSGKNKTSQIKSPILHKNKTNILAKIENNNIYDKFVKIFIRHDYLGNIYCMSVDNYCDVYIAKMYNHYSKLTELTFVNIMKEFVANENIKSMYNIINLLLYGNDDMIDIAGLLLGLIKEKNNKNNTSINLYDLIYNNMTYFLQSKIKKSNNNVKQSINKIKNISIDDIDYRKQLVLCKNIPPNVKVMVLEKIEEMKSVNNEYYKQLLYVKTILNYPWSSPTDDIFYENMRNNSNKAMEYLNNVEGKLKMACYGHDEAKKLLLQMIAKWISNPSSHGTCFGMVGPPGVGKTLLAKSVSEALDIPFAQITLGGQNDGELLHGHGYTYSGSQPGMIIKKMVEMGKSRCILYFDELDKTCSKHGSLNEITSILIHLTDPNMNKTFQDRFFQGVEFPLDKVIMIFSYNDSKLVDPILLDRLKEIKVQPYTIEDKLNICQNYLIRDLASSVSMDNIVNISDNMIEYIIENYTNEAGVREIKRKIEDIFMNLNIDRIYKRNLFKKITNKIILTKKKIIDILKEPDSYKRLIHDMPMVGIINGMYATSSGNGGITPIQIYPNLQQNENKYEIKLTGKQGDVMKESAICSLTCALEYLKSYDINQVFSNNLKNGFHVHTPDGATPKDGPSAGCAFTCAFISRILNRKIKNDIAMTGEIELTGKVSKIGGLEFKLQGAKKAGIKIAYVPFENLKDVVDIKEKYKNLIDKDFNVKTFSNISDIIEEILL